MAKAVTLKNPDGTTIYPITKVEAVDGVNPNYSTSEVDTGAKWIDEREIYSKTFYIADTGSGTTTNIPHNISSLRQVVKIEGFYVDPDGKNYPLPSYGGSASYLHIMVDQTNLSIDVGTTGSANKEAWITIFYTKA